MLELITAALIAGATAGVTGVATDAVKDAYTGLKNILVRKFSKTKGAIAAVEADPEDKEMQKVMSDRLSEANAAADAEVQAAATRLAEALKAAGIPVATTSQTATGTGNVQVAGSGNTTTSNVSTGNSGVNVQGSTVGDIVQGDNVGGDKIGRQVNTGGGTYVEGDVKTGGDFVGRDKHSS